MTSYAARCSYKGAARNSQKEAALIRKNASMCMLPWYYTGCYDYYYYYYYYERWLSRQAAIKFESPQHSTAQRVMKSLGRESGDVVLTLPRMSQHEAALIRRMQVCVCCLGTTLAAIITITTITTTRCGGCVNVCVFVCLFVCVCLWCVYVCMCVSVCVIVGQMGERAALVPRTAVKLIRTNLI
jgi:hypothetical protein